MTSIKDLLQSHFTSIILSCFAILGLVIVIQTRDALGLLGWIFSFATVLVVGNGSQDSRGEEF